MKYVSVHKVRNGVFAYKIYNGFIIICNDRFFDYSIKEAIRIWREKNPIRKK